MGGTTSKLLLPYPVASDPDNVPADVLALANRIETVWPGIATVSSLPGTPYDGQVVDYLADATNGVVWRLRYRAASGSAFKWEFVGGSPLVATIDTLQTTAQTAFADLPTPGPTVTVPLAGDYFISHGAMLAIIGASAIALVSYSLGATAAVDGDAASAAAITPAPDRQPTSRINRKNGILAASAITLKYRVTTAVSVNWQNRWLQVQPVRVG